MAAATLSSRKKKSPSKKTKKKTSSKSGSGKSRGSIGELAKLMAGIDICMMTTTSANGSLVSRPMSNNGEVDYDGTSYFFTWTESGVAKELKLNKNVNLAFEASRKTYVSAAGKARLVTNKSQMEDHWSPDLDEWFPQGLETDGILMIEVKAKRIKYWNGERESEVKV